MWKQSNSNIESLILLLIALALHCSAGNVKVTNAVRVHSGFFGTLQQGQNNYYNHNPPTNNMKDSSEEDTDESESSEETFDPSIFTYYYVPQYLPPPTVTPFKQGQGGSAVVVTDRPILRKKCHGRAPCRLRGRSKSRRNRAISAGSILTPGKQSNYTKPGAQTSASA